MRTAARHKIAFFCVVSLLGGSWAEAQTNARNDVQRGLDQLRGGLGEGENAQRWHDYLHLELLEQQLAGAAQPDRQVLARVHGRFHRDTSGLERPRFVLLRDAIQRWLNELPPLTEQQLAAAAESAREDFAPVPDERVEQARAELDAAVLDLEHYLARGTAANAERWKQYLLWEPMVELLDQPRPRAALVRTISRRYFTNASGIERARFQRVRDALTRYADLLEVTDEESKRAAFGRIFLGQADQIPELLQAETQQAQYEALLATLAEQLAEYREARTPEAGWRIGRLVGLLDQAGRAPEVVRGVRRHYWYPNFYGQASERLISAGISDPVVETTPVKENIMGTSVHGTAVLRGNVGLQLAPSEDTARFNLVLSGIAHSNTVGYNRSVRIFSTGMSQVNATKQLLVDANGLRATSAVARVCTNTTINCISAHLRIIENIAWKQAARTKGSAEQVASRRAEARTSSRMDAQSVPLLQDANQRIEEQFRTPLIRLGAFPRTLNFRTTRDSLFVRALTANRDQLGAPTAPPPIANPRDLAARIHESLAGNFTEAALGGQTLRNTRLAQLHEELTGDIPEELVVTDVSELWSIRFSTDRPIRTNFANREVLIAIHADEFIRYGQTYEERREVTRENIIISARYTMDQTPAGPVLNRQELAVNFPTAPPQIGIRRIGIRSFLGRKFDSVFKEQITPEGFQLGGRWEGAGALRVQSMDSRHGWLLLAWELFPNETRAAQTAAVAAARDAR